MLDDVPEPTDRLRTAQLNDAGASELKSQD